MSSACGSLRDTAIGSLTGAATYDACNSDTISISANQFPTSTADRQYNVQREVCGDGEVIVKVLSVSGGMAGLELRADNAPGSKKVGLRTTLGNLAYRFGRTTTDAAQSSGNVVAVAHRWLKVVRSGSSVSTYTSTNGSNWSFAVAYTISLPDCVQATLFMQSINANTTHTGVFNNLQFSGFTNSEGDPTTVAFDQDTISADAGDTVNICLNITNPCICSPTEVEVELQGSGSPHLSGYSTETLVFEDTTEQLCFPLVISGAAGSANYTLSLDNVSGGNGAEAGTPENLVIRVTGDPLSFCGVILRESLHTDSIPAASDRFGNNYTAHDLKLVGRGEGCPGTDYFVLNYTNMGLFTLAEQQTICQVFNDLADLIDNPLNVEVQIRIEKSALPLTLLGAGTPYYEIGCEIGYPAAFACLEGQYPEDSDIGRIEIANHVVDWHTLNEDPLAPNSNLFDLYSVVLHEAMHVLGIGTRIGITGNPVADNFYSSWDRFLETATGNPLIIPETEDPQCCNDYTFNDELPTTSVNAFLNSLVSNCGGTGGIPSIVFDEGDVFPTINGTQSGAPHVHLQALSHLDEQCDNLPAGSYVMHWDLSAGQARRVLHEAEQNILRHLGYVVNEQNGTGEDCIMVAYDDRFNNFSIVPGQSLIIPFEFLMFNDLISPGAGATISYDEANTDGAEFILVDAIDTDMNMEDDAFEITALPITGVFEDVVFRYRLEGCNEDCSDAVLDVTIINSQLAPDCPNVGYCDNHICNGDFETFTPGENFYWAEAGLSPVFYTPGAGVNANNSPDVGYEGANSAINENQFMRLRASESLYMPLERSIMAGCTLTLRLRATGETLSRILVSENPPCLLYSNPSGCLEDHPDLCLVAAGAPNLYLPHCIHGQINPMGSGSQGQTVNGQIYYAPNLNSWEPYEIEWVNNTDDPVNWIIFDQSQNIRIDDIVVTQSCPATVEIVTEEIAVCNLGVTEICFDVCMADLVEGTEVELSAIIELPAGFVVASGSATTTLTFSENECQTVCLSIMNTEDFLEEEFNLPIEVSQCGEILDEGELPIVVIGCTLSCEDCIGTTVIGEANETTLLSEVIGADPGELPENVANGIEICIAGTFVVDQGYAFINSTLLMQPGAQIIVATNAVLDVINSQFLGCDEMWRGIELENRAQIKMFGSIIRDAQYALYIQPTASGEELTEGTVSGNAFVNNFVSLFVPKTAGGKINLLFSDNRIFQTETVLKPPYSGQTSAPELLPAQEDRALAGVIVNNLGAFSSYRNHFEALTAGIIANQTTLVAENNSFAKTLIYDTEYLNFTGRGTGIRCDANGSTTTTARGNVFSNGLMGISSNFTRLTASGNTISNAAWGIAASQANAGGITIDNNTIHNARFAGIWLVHAHPQGSVLIEENIISTDAETDGVGIGLWANSAPAILRENEITVEGTGVGIGLASSSRAELLNNTVQLENADQARSGIFLSYAKQSALRNNTVLGVDIAGDANENIALEIASSPGNAYCCNTLDNTRLGVSVFGGSLTTDQFRGTTFGKNTTSLYLPNANAVLGSQTHTENCWQGNSGAAVYGVNLPTALQRSFIVDAAANSCFLPPSHSPTGWFQNLSNSTPEVVCSSEICKTANFKPDSDDVKRLTDGDTTLLTAVRWELQRYIYEKLLTEAPEDTTNEKFRDNVENTTIGFFQAINESIAAMFAADSVSRAALNANLILASGKLDSLILIDSLVIIEDDSTEIAGLIQTRGELVGGLFDLASDSEALTEEISDNFSDAADDIRAVNDTITVIEDFEINEKVVNDLYLAYLAEADTSEMDTLEAIAVQCPLLGGNAVYRARALLAMMTGELVSYNDSLTCASIQAFSLPQGHHTSFQVATDLTIFPNPANGEVNIRWKRAPEKQGQIQITDLYGRHVRQMIIAPGAAEIKIPADYLSDGMYFFRIRLDDLETTRKVIIQH